MSNQTKKRPSLVLKLFQLLLRRLQVAMKNPRSLKNVLGLKMTSSPSSHQLRPLCRRHGPPLRRRGVRVPRASGQFQLLAKHTPELTQKNHTKFVICLNVHQLVVLVELVERPPLRLLEGVEQLLDLGGDAVAGDRAHFWQIKK